MKSSATNGLAAVAGDPVTGAARLHDLLDERLRFETLLSRLSATFIRIRAKISCLKWGCQP